MFRKHFKRLVTKKYEKKTEFNGHAYDSSVDYDATDIDVILNIHKYLMNKNNIV